MQKFVGREGTTFLYDDESEVELQTVGDKGLNVPLADLLDFAADRLAEPVRPQERRLLNWLYGTSANLVLERKSPRLYDLRISGTLDSVNFSAWLPLAFLHSLDWTKPEIALRTDYPEMAASGDWSGVRDTTCEQIWEIFEDEVAKLG